MIEIKDLYKTYHKGKSNALPVLKGISLTIKDGELLAIMGKSGAGKSTLMHILACIEQAEEGSFLLNGKELLGADEKTLAKARNREIGVVLQDFALIPDYSVLENVMVPLFFTAASKKKRKTMAMEALTKIGISDLAEKQVTNLSGGQKQRVAIARAIVNHPPLLLADEPTGALDEATGQTIMDVFLELQKTGHTVVIVTHEPGIAAQCGRVVRLSDGEMIL